MLVEPKPGALDITAVPGPAAAVNARQVMSLHCIGTIGVFLGRRHKV
jgi:hypothetical protein